MISASGPVKEDERDYYFSPGLSQLIINVTEWTLKRGHRLYWVLYLSLWKVSLVQRAHCSPGSHCLIPLLGDEAVNVLLVHLVSF